MSLLGAVMQAGFKLLSKPRADEFGSPWPERADAASQRKGQKFGLVDQAGGHHDAGARRRHWSHQGRSQARAS